MTEEVKAKIHHLVGVARAANRRVLEAKRLGFRHPAAEYIREKAILDARVIRGDAGSKPGNSLKVCLARLADLTCELDEEKNRLPEQYRWSFAQVVEGTHDYIKAIADKHGVKVYMDQQEKSNRDRKVH